MNPKVGIVVPTLGQRPEYLELSLRSIRAAGDAYIVLVCPSTFDAKRLLDLGLIDQLVDDPKTGLSEAINFGVKSLPKEVELVNWLGDDDLLAPNTLSASSAVLLSDPKNVMVFGSCSYIDSEGLEIWLNRSGPWAVPLLRIGPDLIPQPGALFRRSAFERVGGLTSEFDWAFDFDLFIKLSKLGHLIFTPVTLASFRWHPDSLSVGQRKRSVDEASRVRISHLPTILRPISGLWESPVKLATLIAGKRMTRKAQTQRAKR